MAARKPRIHYELRAGNVVWRARLATCAAHIDPARLCLTRRPQRALPRVDVRLAVQIIAQCDSAPDNLAHDPYASANLHTGAMFNYRA